jgi:hypothetical protein
MKDNTIEIFVNEEYGYKTWIWRPNMTEEEFVAWWQSLTETDIIKYFFNIKSLPGNLKPHTVKETVTNGESMARMVGDPKTYQPYYYCHMHDVDDTFMCIGKNRYSFQRTTRRDWKDYWIDWTLKNEKSVVM